MRERRVLLLLKDLKPLLCFSLVRTRHIRTHSGKEEKKVFPFCAWMECKLRGLKLPDFAPFLVYRDTHTRTHTRRYCFVGGSGANGGGSGKTWTYSLPSSFPDLSLMPRRSSKVSFSLSFWRDGFRWFRPRTFGQCSCKHFCYMRHFWTIATNIGTISLANPNIKRSYAYHTLN